MDEHRVDERVVAGLHCGEVVADLTASLDNGLSAERARQVQEHVRGCEACKRFAAELTAAVRALRETLGEPAADPELEQRLLARLHAETGQHG